jgi:cysteinyl-tRNA synthetase
MECDCNLTIKVFNRLTRKLEDFEPIEDNKVKMYVCGLTVQDFAHIGHARTYVAFDVIKRYLEFRGYSVLHVQNTTDVEDKIIARAQEIGTDPVKLASKYTMEAGKDLDAMGIERANVYPRVTENMDEIINVVKKLVDGGYAYCVDGDVYFSVDKFPDYGLLSHQSPNDVLVGARIEVNERKRNPVDFAVWKSAKKGELSFDSPWGRGRPGWHIECSAMAMKYLGERIDIHGGGTDLIFPHHENEIAQSEAATGKKPFVKYWLHTGLLNINGEKMSKSLGNFITVKDLLKKWEPDAFRLYIISTHYSTPIEFSENALEQSEKSLTKIRNTMDELEKRLGTAKKAKEAKDTSVENTKRTNKFKSYESEVEKIELAFIEAMDYDFNSPQALVVFQGLVRLGNRALAEGASRDPLELIQNTLRKLASVFGLSTVMISRTLKKRELPKGAAALMKEREEARKSKNWKRSDEIREQLRIIGIEVEDTLEGTQWKYAKQMKNKSSDDSSLQS